MGICTHSTFYECPFLVANINNIVKLPQTGNTQKN